MDEHIKEGLKRLAEDQPKKQPKPSVSKTEPKEENKVDIKETKPDPPKIEVKEPTKAEPQPQQDPATQPKPAVGLGNRLAAFGGIFGKKPDPKAEAKPPNENPPPVVEKKPAGRLDKALNLLNSLDSGEFDQIMTEKEIQKLEQQPDTIVEDKREALTSPKGSEIPSTQRSERNKATEQSNPQPAQLKQSNSQPKPQTQPQKDPQEEIQKKPSSKTPEPRPVETKKSDPVPTK
jgi:hypothetical protein